MRLKWSRPFENFIENVLKYDVVMSLNLIKLAFEHNLKEKIIMINDIIPIVNKLDFLKNNKCYYVNR